MGVETKIVPLIEKEKIVRRIREISEQINQDYKNDSVICVCVLKGSVIFFSDLVRELKIPVEFDFVRVSSYGDELVSKGDVKITKDLSETIKDRNVLVVEDIVDTGITLSFLLDLFRSREPKSLRVCSLLYKPANSVKKVAIDYLGFTIDKHYVVGYGMDAAEQFRNLDYVGIYKG